MHRAEPPPTPLRVCLPSWLLVVLAGLGIGLGRPAGSAAAPASPPRWSLLRPGGRAPQALQWASWAHDPVRNRLLVFGGFDQIDEQNELWALDLDDETWELVRPRGTAPYYRQRAAMAFDLANDRAVIFGGYDLDVSNGRPNYYNETWFAEFGGSGGPTWRKLAFGGPTPRARRGATMVYQDDPATGTRRMVLFGGYNHVEGQGFADVWALDLTPGSEAWRELSPCGGPPPPRDGHAAVYDQRGTRMAVFGGWNHQRVEVTLDDTWLLDLRPGQECWSPGPSGSSSPPGVGWTTGVYDSCAASPRMLVFGGYSSTAHKDTADTWELSLVPGSPPEWSKLDTTGSRPRARDSHVAAYDPAGRRQVIHAGWENEGELVRDVWALAFDACAAATPSPAATDEPTPTSDGPVTPGAGTVVPPWETTPPPTVTGAPSATPDALGTSVAGTLTAMAPTPTATTTPDAIGTAVAGTLTAQAPTATLPATASPTQSPSDTPDVVATSISATLTALAPTPAPGRTVYLSWCSSGGAGATQGADGRAHRAPAGRRNRGAPPGEGSG